MRMSKLPLNEEILPPSDDHVFKTLMTHPDAKPALMDLLSAIIGRVVIDVQIRNNELPATDIEEKAERLDVNCVVDGGDQVNVEMQGARMAEPNEKHENFINKYIYYLTDLHSSQKSKGVKYYDLARTYQVTFSTYTVFPHRRDYITQSGMRTPDGELISDQINMVIIELSKLEETIRKPINDMTSLEMWSIFLGYADNPKHRERINEMIERKEVLGMAGALLTAISKDEHERAKFMSRRKAETDRISDLLTERDNGRKEGLAEGLAKGRADAIKELVRNMKAMKISDGDIARATGLTLHEIESL